MGFLTALIPAPYRILALVLLFVASVGTGYVKGRLDESNVERKRETEVKVIAVQQQAKKQVAVATVRAASAERVKVIEQQGAAAIEKVNNREVFPPANNDCAVPFAPDRMRNILDAWGVAPGDRPERKDGNLREPATPGERER